MYHAQDINVCKIVGEHVKKCKWCGPNPSEKRPARYQLSRIGEGRLIEFVIGDAAEAIVEAIDVNTAAIREKKT
jgi:hypothetical protein